MAVVGDTSERIRDLVVKVGIKFYYLVNLELFGYCVDYLPTIVLCDAR